MPWSDTGGSSFDLTHLADMGTFAVGPPGITFYPSQLVPSVMGSTYLITVAAAAAGTAYVTLIVEHLDPSGNVVWSQKLPGVHAAFADGATVVRGPAFASDLRITVGVGTYTLAGTPTAAVVRVYSSPNQQHRPTRVVGGSTQSSTMTDAVLASTNGSLAPAALVEFPLRPYAGLTTISLSASGGPVTDFLFSIRSRDSAGTVFDLIPGSQGEISLPAGVNTVRLTNTGIVNPLGYIFSAVAKDFTL